MTQPDEGDNHSIASEDPEEHQPAPLTETPPMFGPEFGHATCCACRRMLRGRIRFSFFFQKCAALGRYYAAAIDGDGAADEGGGR